MLYKDSGSTSLEGLGHLCYRLVGELGIVDYAYGRSDVLALLAGHTGNDCLFQHVDIVGQSDRKVSDRTCDRILHILVSDAGEHKDVSLPCIDRERTGNIGDHTCLGALDVHGSPDYRLRRLLCVDHDTPDCQFGT